jgi:putative FmdB family regulatory protein
MPLYEYACQDCTHEFETLVQGDEKVHCPKCDSEHLERLLSVPARPRAESALPTACNSTGPPCGPMCRRFNGS